MVPRPKCHLRFIHAQNADLPVTDSVTSASYISYHRALRVGQCPNRVIPGTRVRSPLRYSLAGDPFIAEIRLSVPQKGGVVPRR